MKLINLNSKKGIVNLFADYVLQHIEKNKNTIIQVTDFNHFFIVNGVTNSETVLDISKIKDSFVSENQDLLKMVGYDENISIMDLIKYNEKIEECKSLECDFFNSNRNVYHQSLNDYEFTNKEIYSIDYINNFVFETERGYKTSMIGFHQSPLQITSEFPHGYSLSMGRDLLYYSEYIAHNISSSIISEKLTILLTKEKVDEEQEIIIHSSDEFVTNTELKSMILDVFNFDFESFNKKFETYDFCDDIKKPTDEKPWLVKDINPIDSYIF